MKNNLLSFYEKEGTKKVLASLLSILIGLCVGALIVVVVGLTKESISVQESQDMQVESLS